VIPSLLSLYLLLKNWIWGSAAIATLIVTIACYLLAKPVAGIGIALPFLAPPIIAAMAALLVARTNVAAVAYISGSLGTLIGRTCSILAGFRHWALRSSRLEEPVLLTAYF
jgi:uncharacterized membrane protein